MRKPQTVSYQALNQGLPSKSNLSCLASFQQLSFPKFDKVKFIRKHFCKHILTINWGLDLSMLSLKLKTNIT